MPAEPVRPRRLRLWLIAAILLVGGTAVHAAVWRSMADGLEAGVDAWIAARRAQGWAVAHGPRTRGGWPLAATLDLPEIRMEGGFATVPGGVAWTIERARLRLALPRLDRVVIALAGRQTLRLGPLAVPFTADRLDLALAIERGVPPRGGTAVTERLRIGTAAGAIEARRAEAGLAVLRTAVEGEAAIEVSLAGSDVDLPPGVQPALAMLGRRIARFEATLSLSGPWPHGGGPAARAETWRDGGGTAQLRIGALAWGPALLDAEATVALDDALQPMGAGTLRLIDAGTVLEAAAGAGLLPVTQLPAARAILRLLEREPEGDGRPELVAPVLLEDRVLAVARIPLLRLPAWVWPRGG